MRTKWLATFTLLAVLMTACTSNRTRETGAITSGGGVITSTTVTRPDGTVSNVAVDSTQKVGAAAGQVDGSGVFTQGKDNTYENRMGPVNADMPRASVRMAYSVNGQNNVQTNEKKTDLAGGFSKVGAALASGDKLAVADSAKDLVSGLIETVARNDKPSTADSKSNALQIDLAGPNATADAVALGSKMAEIQTAALARERATINDSLVTLRDTRLTEVEAAVAKQLIKSNVELERLRAAKPTVDSKPAEPDEPDDPVVPVTPDGASETAPPFSEAAKAVKTMYPNTGTGDGNTAANWLADGNKLQFKPAGHSSGKNVVIVPFYTGTTSVVVEHGGGKSTANSIRNYGNGFRLNFDLSGPVVKAPASVRLLPSGVVYPIPHPTKNEGIKRLAWPDFNTTGPTNAPPDAPAVPENTKTQVVPLGFTAVDSSLDVAVRNDDGSLWLSPRMVAFLVRPPKVIYNDKEADGLWNGLPNKQATAVAGVPGLYTINENPLGLPNLNGWKIDVRRDAGYVGPITADDPTSDCMDLVIFVAEFVVDSNRGGVSQQASVKRGW